MQQQEQYVVLPEYLDGSPTSSCHRASEMGRLAAVARALDAIPKDTKSMHTLSIHVHKKA